MINIDTLLRGRSVELFDGSEDLARDLLPKTKNRMTVFTRGHIPGPIAGIKFSEYSAILEAADCMASVCMLNGASIKSLVAMYPSAPKYVLVRIAFRLSWLLGILGLLRRVVQGLVRIEGVTVIPRHAGRGKTFWLVLEQSGTDIHQIPVIPYNLGIQGFLDWLKQEKLNYIVLRFFEKLPNLHREAGDLDLLVSDDDLPKIINYLSSMQDQSTENVGDVRVGLHSVSGEPGLIPYYPPPLARAMLARAIPGPANAMIPCPKDSLLSLIYHALYHTKKGYASGIPSELSKYRDSHPENDYAGIIASKSSELGIDVGSTMEAMDEFMANNGWRPKIDTLAKIAETNAWVRDRFFKNITTRAEGIAVLVLREWVVRANLVDRFVDEIHAAGFIVLRRKILKKSEVKFVHDHLRGGTWGADNDGNTELWHPAAVLVLIDPECASLPATYSTGVEYFRIRKLKEQLRSKFDTERSSVHSTDNSLESWEYIENCFPDEVVNIKNEVNRYTKLSIVAMIKQLLNPKFIKHTIKHKLRSYLIRKFLT